MESDQTEDAMYDSLDEALMETFPASDPIAVDAVTPLPAADGDSGKRRRSEPAIRPISDGEGTLPD